MRDPEVVFRQRRKHTSGTTPLCGTNSEVSRTSSRPAHEY